MRSRLDREISRRLLQEVPTEPTVKNSRIDQLLYRVRAEDVQDAGKSGACILTIERQSQRLAQPLY